MSSRRRAWPGAVAGASALFLAAFLAYFLVYRVRHFALPLGWDTPWYVWRADFVAAEGLGPLGTSARPGHALLSAVLGAVTSRSQLELQVVVPFVLVGLFALAVGALVAEGTGGGPARWAVAAATTAALLGGTRLVGENVANLLHVLLVVAGLVVLLRLVREGRGFAGAVLLLVAAGMAHWLFLGVTGLVLMAWFGLALPSSLRARRAGVPVRRTESGALAAVGAATGAAVAVAVYPLLSSSLSTFEIREATRRFLPKLREDLSAIAAPVVGPVAAVGGAALWWEHRRDPRPDSGAGTAPFLRLLLSWTLVTLAGLAYAAVSLDLPPHRFLTLLVAVPVMVAVGTAVALAAGWAWRRGTLGRAAAPVLVAGAVAALALPGMRVWYGPADLVDGVVVNVPAEGPEQWFDVAAFDQARTAAAYLESLPPDRPAVFVVSPVGASGPISTALKERTIRAALPPDRQEDVRVFPGSPADLLAGRPSLVGNEEVDEANLPYWEEVRAVLPLDPAVLVLEALGSREHAESVDKLGATGIAPGVAVLRGPLPSAFRAPDPVRPVPTTEVGTAWAVLILLLLALAGAGWTAWFLGPAPVPLVAVSLAPAVGAGMLSLGGLVAAVAGLPPGGATGVAIFALVTVAGAALALYLPGQRAATRATQQ